MSCKNASREKVSYINGERARQDVCLAESTTCLKRQDCYFSTHILLVKTTEV